MRQYLRTRLGARGLDCQVDGAGNLIALVPGTGQPVLLNAHMDRVPPGRGHVPVVADSVMRSDGTTNLGADDAAGIAIILSTVAELAWRSVRHPPLALLFTVGEEVGLKGADAFDPAPWHVREGIVFDNAGEAGSVVTRASSYIAFDAELRGRGGHPGKDLGGTVSAIEILRRLKLPTGSLDGDRTRISLGMVQGGSARNAIPTEVHLAGEVRTRCEGDELRALLTDVAQHFTAAANELGGSAQCRFEPHGTGYIVDPGEPLLTAWRAAWLARGHASLPTITTFIGSDTNALRQHLRVFTISTGVEDEHTTEERIALAPLAEIVRATVALLEQYP
jgi:tripeptide aminopeptidase